MTTSPSNIPVEAVEAAAKAYRREFPYDENEGYVVKLILEAAAPHMLRGVWQSAYDQGVDDERISQANPGIAGCFCHSKPCRCIIAPARENPYRPAVE